LSISFGRHSLAHQASARMKHWAANEPPLNLRCWPGVARKRSPRGSQPVLGTRNPVTGYVACQSRPWKLVVTWDRATGALTCPTSLPRAALALKGDRKTQESSNLEGSGAAPGG
jgi:hypothetical protein